MGKIAGFTTNNIKLANTLSKELDPKTFDQLITFLGQANAKAILLQNRAKRHGF
jgi:hypothetical protein